MKGQTELFDAIVLTMPTPQVLQLKGTIAEIIGILKYIALRMMYNCQALNTIP